MEVTGVFGPDTPEVVRGVARSMERWHYDLPIPTADTRCLGFILEQSIALHLQREMPDCGVALGGAITYPNLHVTTPRGLSLAFEVKASPKLAGIGNRVKSPESTLAFYDRFDGHWVLAIFYDFNADKTALRSFRICVLQLWQYASATFKDMSALSSLGSLDAMLRKVHTERAFRDEPEFLEFLRYMSHHPGTTAQRNAHARQWMVERRKTSEAKRQAG